MSRLSPFFAAELHVMHRKITIHANMLNILMFLAIMLHLAIHPLWANEIEDNSLAIFDGQIEKVEILSNSLFYKWLLTIKIKSIKKQAVNTSSFKGNYFIATHSLVRKFDYSSNDLVGELIGKQYTFYLFDKPESDIYSGNFTAKEIN